ncbi:MAG: hypothetical protein WC859_04730 [Elusimicrobiota bacterium]|jgi:hypothetical protein
MLCPKCQFDNPPGSEMCGFCHELLARTIKMGGGVIKIYGDAFHPGETSSPFDNLAVSPYSSVRRPKTTRFSPLKYLLLFLLGIAGIMTGVRYYSSRHSRPPLQSTRFEHPAGLHQALTYVVGTQSKSHSWAEHNGVMDTPLPDANSQETGSVSVKAALPNGVNSTLVIRPQEWIRFVRIAETAQQQTIPKNHPSLAPAKIVMDPQRTLLERLGTDALRVGRVSNLIFPRFPKEALRPGNGWTETVQWAELLGEWTVFWRADLSWTFQKYDLCFNLPCARLTYQARLTPQLVGIPAWANTQTGPPAFVGQARGEALFDLKNKCVLSNQFGYSGKLSIPIKSLERIPWELRVGNPLTAEPGHIVIQFDEKIDARNL